MDPNKTYKPSYITVHEDELFRILNEIELFMLHASRIYVRAENLIKQGTILPKNDNKEEAGNAGKEAA